MVLAVHTKGLAVGTLDCRLGEQAVPWSWFTAFGRKVATLFQT